MRRVSFAGMLVVVMGATSSAGTWVPTGPRGNLGTGDGEQAIGRIASIQIHQATGMLYVGASSGGLWRTTPAPGRTPVWEDLGANLPHPSVGAIAVHPANTSDILVGTGDSGREADDAGGFFGGTGIYHTTNAGGSWTRVFPSSPFGAAPATIYRVLYQPGSASVLVAATSGGLFRSTQGADGPWDPVAAGAITDLVFDPSNANTAFACVIGGSQGTGIYKSVNGGQTWNSIKSVSPASRGAIAICRYTPRVLASVWESGVTVTAVLKSPDGGSTWPNLPATPIIGANGNAGDVLAIAIAPNDTGQVYIGAQNLWWTLDSGANWVSNPPRAIAHHADITQLYWSPLDDTALWFCSDGGVYRYPLGADHSDSFNGDNVSGLQISQLYRVQARRNLRFGAMQDDGINGSVDGGATWKTLHIGPDLVDGGDVAITQASDTNPLFWFIYGIVAGGYPLGRGAFNAALQLVTPAPPVPKISGLYFDRFGASDSGRVFAVRYSNGTGSSQLISYPILANDTTVSRVEATGPVGIEGLTGNWLDGQTFYAWVKNLNLVPPANPYNVVVFRRSGPTWNVTQQLIGTPGEKRNVMQIHVSRKWPGEAWAALDGAANDAKVFHTTDHGATWTDISGDLTGQQVGSVYTIVASPFDSNELYIGTGRRGVFRTLNGGAHWEAFQTGLPLVTVHDMVYVTDESHDGTDKLVIGTYGRGTYECALDRAGPVYVDQRNTSPPWLGTLEDPDLSIAQGLADTPFFGRMLLNGSIVFAGPRTLGKPMTVGSYEFPAHVGP